MGMGRNKKLIVTLIGLALMNWGCAEKSTSSNGNSNVNNPTAPAGPYVPPGSTGSDSPSSLWNYGSSVTLTIDGSTDYAKIQNMADYTGRSMNNPTDIKLNINAVKRDNDGYGGRISVSYYDNGEYREGVFVNGDESYFPNTSETKAAKYNVWYDNLGTQVFHGFFQDLQGGMILVIDGYDSVEVGDGQAPTNARGSVWYKNFEPTYAPHSPSHCWFVSIGPYDCRSWKSGDGVNTYQQVNPTNGYKKLGEFTGLDVGKAFNM